MNVNRRVDRARTNPTARASKCRDLAAQFAAESIRWIEGSKQLRQLTAARLQLAYMARAVDALDPQTIEAYIDTAEQLLAVTIVARAFGSTHA